MPSVLVVADAIVDHNGEYVGDSLVIEDGVIVAIGYGVSREYAAEYRVKGYIMPGFIDAHLHLSGLGLSFYGVDLRGTRSIREFKERLSRASGPIAYGRGWDQEFFLEKRYPTRRDLDSVIGDKPAVTVRVCGHAAVANTVALSLTKPWEVYPDLVDRDKGLLLEDAVGYVVEKLLESVDVEPLVEKAASELRNHGIVGASSMACGRREAEALAGLDRRGALSIRVACYAPPNELEAVAEALRGSHRASLVGVKLFADGSLGARTARLSSDYADDPGNRGRLLLDSRRIAGIAEKTLAKGLRVAVHAIGDEALDEVIEAYSEVGPRGSGRVEHASVARDEQVRMLASLGVYVVVQPHFRVTDWWVGERLGDRVHLVYRFKTMLEAGVKLALSTDAPVEPHDPVETFKAAVGRCIQVSCRPEESLSPSEVIRLYTVEASRASGGPVAALGVLEKGAPAELSWSPSDPLDRNWEGPLRILALHSEAYKD